MSKQILIVPSIVACLTFLVGCESFGQLGSGSNEGLSSAMPSAIPRATPSQDGRSNPQSAIFDRDLASLSEGYTGLSRQVALPINAGLGQGYSIVSGALRGFGLKRDALNSIKSKENAINYDLTYINSYRKLATTMKLDVSASFAGGSGGASASMSLFRSVDFSSRKAYVLVNMTVLNGSESLIEFSLSKNALKQLTSYSNSNEFVNRYGEAFLVRVVKGAQLYALLEFSNTEQESVEKLKAEVKGSYGAFKGGANFESSLKELVKNRNVRIYYSQTGGGTGRQPSAENEKYDYSRGGALILSPEELLSRVREFPGEARADEGGEEAAAVLWGEVLDYRVSENWPSRYAIGPFLEVHWALSDLGASKLLVDQLRNDAADVITSGIYSGEDSNLKLATDVERYASYISEQMARLAAATTAYPYLYTKLSEPILPSFADFRDSENSHQKPVNRKNEIRKGGSRAQECDSNNSNFFNLGCEKVVAADLGVSFGCRNAYGDDVPCASPPPSCPAALPYEHAVFRCLTGSEIVYTEPKKIVIALGEPRQFASIAYWAQGNSSRAFKCQSIPAGFDLVDVEKKREVKVPKRDASCLGSGPFCDSHGESCANVFFVKSCYVNRSWHKWYIRELTASKGYYDAAEVCKESMAKL